MKHRDNASDTYLRMVVHEKKLMLKKKKKLVLHEMWVNYSRVEGVMETKNKFAAMLNTVGKMGVISSFLESTALFAGTVTVVSYFKYGAKTTFTSIVGKFKQVPST